jgi:hypothetical protein
MSKSTTNQQTPKRIKQPKPNKRRRNLPRDLGQHMREWRDALQPRSSDAEDYPTRHNCANEQYIQLIPQARSASIPESGKLRHD